MMSGAVMEERFRRLGLQRGNSVGRAVFLSKGQACRGILPEICQTINAGDWDADIVEVGLRTQSNAEIAILNYSLWR